MRKPLLILLAFLLIAGLIAIATYRTTCRLCVTKLPQPADDLDWFRLEFHLSDAELARVRALHDGYRPQCEFHCARIAAGKQTLSELVTSNATPDTIAAQQHAIDAVRAECQSAMLKHFEAVSRAMPPTQGARYLAEMRRITLDRHDEVEAEMADEAHHASTPGSKPLD